MLSCDGLCAYFVEVGVRSGAQLLRENVTFTVNCTK